MTKAVNESLPTSAVTEKIKLSLTKRHRSEMMFKSTGLAAVVLGFILVFVLLFDITSKALPAFHQHWVQLEVDFSEDNLRYSEGASLEDLRYRSTLRKAIANQFPDVKSRRDKRKLYGCLLYTSDAADE